jgi:hypothetical protein
VGCVRQFEEASHELANPRLGQILRHGEGQKRCNRIAAHGGDIAEAAGEAAMADRLGRMQIAPEMDSLQAEIRGHQRLVASGYLEDGAIVPDSGDYAPFSGCPPANARNQRLFSERQDELNIKEGCRLGENYFGKRCTA